jgi:hypothetical protein
LGERAPPPEVAEGAAGSSFVVVERVWRWLACATVVFATVSACSGGGDGAAPIEGAEPAATQVDVDALDLEGHDVDEVVVMRPGGFARAGDMGGQDWEIVRERHILRTSGPDGPIDLFELQILAPEFDGLQRCEAVVFSDGGSGMGCSPMAGPAAVGPNGQQMLRGGSGSERLTTFEIVGPAETTHFVVEIGERRLALIPVEGWALLVVAGPFCEQSPTLVEAWQDRELLRSEDGFDLC